MGYQHPKSRLTPRRKNVLALRAYGLSYREIARTLGISVEIVRKDLLVINRIFCRTFPDGDVSAMGYRVIYMLGLIDAGVEPDDVPDHLQALKDSVMMRVGQQIARETHAALMVPDATPATETAAAH